MTLKRAPLLALLATSVLAGSVAFLAQRRMSATFDEIVLVSGGVRGLAEGRWEMVTDQPPLMMYAYGAAARGVARERPPENREWLFEHRWDYSRALYYRLGNDVRELLDRSRAVAAVVAVLVVAAAGGFAWWIAGPTAGPIAGVIAAVATALLPDVLAHGGVAYNDLALALTFLLAVWAMDAAVRRPTSGRGLVAGVAVAATFGVKMTALALGPVALLLVGAEAWGRRGDRAWLRDAVGTLLIAVVCFYVAMVTLYRGDLSLTLLRFNFWRAVLHASGGHEAPAYLLGRTSATGFWYYFPVAFFLKTPIAFQALLGVGTWGGWAAWRARERSLDRALAWRGRAALLTLLVFGALLVRSELNAGFRYALPALPLLAVLASVGASRVWRRWRREAIAGLLLVQAASVLTAYPHFLAYTSEWVGGRDGAHEVLLDSSIDWGQGLLDLRRFMDEEGVASVRLSYFGSAPPDAFGVEYVALPSFFRLDFDRTAGAEESPRFTAISATNLRGLYLQGRDPFAAYRGREPYRVLGHTMFVYDEG